METFKKINYWVKIPFAFIALIVIIFLLWICDWLGAVEQEMENK